MSAGVPCTLMRYRQVYSACPQLDVTWTSTSWKGRSQTSCPRTTSELSLLLFDCPSFKVVSLFENEPTHADGEGLDGVSVPVVGVGTQQVASLLVLIIQTLEAGTLLMSNRKQAALAPTHVNVEVSGGAGDLPAWRQSFGGVLQGDGSREDGHGELDHQEASGTSEGPTVSRVDVRLEVRAHELKTSF